MPYDQIPTHISALIDRVGSKLRAPIPSDEDLERRRLARAAEAAARLPELLAKVGVPLRTAEVLVQPDSTSALDETVDWWRSEETFLLLAGGVGAGKTVAAAWPVRAVVSEVLDGSASTDRWALQRRATFVRAGEMARTCLSDYSAEDRDAFRDWCRARLLVIDDLGAERGGDAWLARLEELLDVRYGDRRRTVLTTNLDPGTFRQRYGERIADRIRHDGRVVSAGASSLRRRTP